MTSHQRLSILAYRWPAACRAQGWDHRNRQLRLQTISHAIGREITSMNDLDNSRDIDRVYAHLGALANNIDGAMELTPAGAEYGDRRRLLWLIRKHARPLGGDPYILSLARDKFHITQGLNIIEDLSTKQLHQLMMTLNARRHKKLGDLADQSYQSEEQFPDQVAFATADDNQPF